MPRISEIWRMRIILIGLAVLALVPVVLQYMLNACELYEIRLVGGQRPVDLFALQTIGQFSIVCPAIFLVLFVASTIRPALALSRQLLAIAIVVFLLYLILFLCQAVLVLHLRVPLHYTPA